MFLSEQHLTASLERFAPPTVLADLEASPSVSSCQHLLCVSTRLYNPLTRNPILLVTGTPESTHGTTFTTGAESGTMLDHAARSVNYANPHHLGASVASQLVASSRGRTTLRGAGRIRDGRASATRCRQLRGIRVLVVGQGRGNDRADGEHGRVCGLASPFP